jgi:hypothetical protein
VALQLRICWTKYATSEPGFRAQGTGRFDDPLKRYETLYCAPSFDTCYAETLLRERFNVASAQYEVPKAEHDSRSLVALLADFSKLKIVDLYGPGLQSMGLNNMVTMGSYAETRDLSRAIYDHADAPDGIVYLSRFAPSHQPAIVLFDRAKPLVRCFPGCGPTTLPNLPEMFATLSQFRSIALV